MQMFIRLSDTNLFRAHNLIFLLSRLSQVSLSFLLAYTSQDRWSINAQSCQFCICKQVQAWQQITSDDRQLDDRFQQIRDSDRDKISKITPISDLDTRTQDIPRQSWLASYWSSGHGSSLSLAFNPQLIICHQSIIILGYIASSSIMKI